MARVPDADQTPLGPAYEGRLLDHPEEPVVDQGAPFDIRTLITRRSVLGLVGAGGIAMALAACSSVSGASASASKTASATTPTPTPTASVTASATPSATATAASVALPAGEIPDETAGPYPGDGSNGPDVLEQSGIVRSDIRTSLDGGATATGVPMQLQLTLFDTANGDTPFAGAAVYVWHADSQGRYSMYSSGIENESYLRGVQVADANGTVTFTSIYPGCYDGRWPHVHFEVYPDVASITDSSNAIATSQVALVQADSEAVYATAGYPDSAANLARVNLSTDMVFSDDGGVLETPTSSGNATSGFTLALGVRVDAATAPTGGSMPGGGPGGPGGNG